MNMTDKFFVNKNSYVNIIEYICSVFDTHYMGNRKLSKAALQASLQVSSVSYSVYNYSQLRVLSHMSLFIYDKIM